MYASNVELTGSKGNTLKKDIPDIFKVTVGSLINWWFLDSWLAMAGWRSRLVISFLLYLCVICAASLLRVKVCNSSAYNM